MYKVIDVIFGDTHYIGSYDICKTWINNDNVNYKIVLNKTKKKNDIDFTSMELISKLAGYY